MNLLGRIFGPSLGVRLGEDEPAGRTDIEPQWFTLAEGAAAAAT